MPASTNKKPSDRTHEENQERAYIAASRRSDRSVEARVESARRASEIHKRRTGKSLKVTEKDVLAEEMYEEEEDELPSQYRNLNAHLQTSSSDFDARLQAYLANAVAFRKALSGVTKNRDKSKNVDFVNTRQLADHEALFPKHSDAWKDIIIPKAAETSDSPFVPQGTSKLDAKRYSANPYDSKDSSMASRRMSASTQPSHPINAMGTLRPSDLKARTTTTPYRSAARHPSTPQPKVQDAETLDSLALQFPADIQFESLNQSSLEQDDLSAFTQGISPFTSKLPANAIDMLLPHHQSQSAETRAYYDASLFTDSPFQTRPQDSIDATLLAPLSYKTAYVPSVNKEYEPQNYMNNWQQAMPKETSANRKLVEDNMWGNFINDSSTEAWDWSRSS